MTGSRGTCSARTRSGRPWRRPGTRSRRWPPSCPRVAPCTSRSARRRSRSTPCSWPPTTWSTAGTWPRPPGATPGWIPTSCTRSPTGSTPTRRSTDGAGAVAAPHPLTGDAQHDLLARFGRDAAWGPHHRTLVRFNAAFGDGDLDAALALVTDDIVFESTSPAPDGQRYEGRDAVRAAWTEVMRTPGMSFTEEESFVSGDRAVVRWRYAWAARTGPRPRRRRDPLPRRAGLREVLLRQGLSRRTSTPVGSAG